MLNEPVGVVWATPPFLKLPVNGKVEFPYCGFCQVSSQTPDFQKPVEMSIKVDIGNSTQGPGGLVTRKQITQYSQVETILAELVRKWHSIYIVDNKI